MFEIFTNMKKIQAKDLPELWKIRPFEVANLSNTRVELPVYHREFVNAKEFMEELFGGKIPNAYYNKMFGLLAEDWVIIPIFIDMIKNGTPVIFQEESCYVDLSVADAVLFARRDDIECLNDEDTEDLAKDLKEFINDCESFLWKAKQPQMKTAWA